MVNPLSVPQPEPKRPYKKLPPESERPKSRITGRPLSDTEMYAERRTEKTPTPVLPQERLAELRKHVADLQVEISQLEIRIKLLPDEHPLRRQAQMRLETLRQNLLQSNKELAKEETEAEKKAVTSELARTRSMIEDLGRELTARIRSTEQKVISTPAEVAKAIEESKAIMSKMSDIEKKFDAVMAAAKAPAQEPEEVEVPEERPPEEFSILPKYSPITGRLIGFNVSDPEGHTATKLERYLTIIGKEFTKEVDQTALQNAEVKYTEYRATFVLPQPPEIPQTWWTVGTEKGAYAVNEFWQPPATDVARFWQIYHSSQPHPDKGFQGMKDEILKKAANKGMEVKPNRTPNLDRYLWALYQTQAPKLIQSGWFYKTFFEEV
jgi:hypothetical protein